MKMDLHTASAPTPVDCGHVVPEGGEVLVLTDVLSDVPPNPSGVGEAAICTARPCARLFREAFGRLEQAPELAERAQERAEHAYANHLEPRSKRAAFAAACAWARHVCDAELGAGPGTA